MSQPKLPGERISYKAYDDTKEYIEDLYEIYKEAYNLEVIDNEFELADEYAFKYCEERKYFILVVPYSYNKEVLLERVFSNNSLQWTMIGGSFKINETFVECASRLIEKQVKGIELGEVEPLVIIRNIFKYKSNSCEHIGLGFVTRIRNESAKKIIKEALNCRLQLIPYDAEISLSNVFYNDKVLRIAKDYIESIQTKTSAEFEIEQNKKYKNRYRVHNLITKKVFTFLSLFFFKYSIQQLNNRVKNCLNNDAPKKIIDVACGENDKILDFIKEPNIQLIVLNDISWSQLEFLMKKADKKGYKTSQAFLLFTNHDARKLPFKDKYFDSLICKNVLHHMDNLGSVQNLLDEINRISKKVVVVEIMNPNEEGIWGKLRHNYYMRFLKDAGQNFLDRHQFDTITSSSNRKEMFEMKTIRGVYQFALFEN